MIFSKTFLIFFGIKSTFQTQTVVKIKVTNGYNVRLMMNKEIITTIKFIDFDDLNSVKINDKSIMQYHKFRRSQLIFLFMPNNKMLINRPFNENDFGFFFLSLIIKCVDYAGVFSSALYFTKFAQYYKIILAKFVSGGVKTTSNLIYVCMSINRYILLEKESKLAHMINDGISNWSKRKKIFWLVIIFILIALLNSHKIIIYKVVYYSLTNFFGDIYPENFFQLPFFVSNSKFYEGDFNYDEPWITNAKSLVYYEYGTPG